MSGAYQAADNVLDANVLVDVALAPSALAARTEMPLPARTVYIVVDVVRATTTLCTQMEYGAAPVYIAPGIEQARQACATLAAADSDAPRPLLAGESGGVAPAGFDFGNSPAEYTHGDLAGRAIVFATTNGTRALLACAGGAAVLAGALRNARAVAAAASVLAGQVAAEAAPREPRLRYTATRAVGAEASEAYISPNQLARAAVIVVCSGRGGLPAYDDTLCAGVLVNQVQTALRERSLPPRLGEGARIALAAAAQAERMGLREALAASDAGKSVAEVGLGGDLDWCAAVDASDVVPYVTGTAHGDLLVVGRWHAAAK